MANNNSYVPPLVTALGCAAGVFSAALLPISNTAPALGALGLLTLSTAGAAISCAQLYAIMNARDRAKWQPPSAGN